MLSRHHAGSHVPLWPTFTAAPVPPGTLLPQSPDFPPEEPPKNRGKAAPSLDVGPMPGKSRCLINARWIKESDREANE